MYLVELIENKELRNKINVFLDRIDAGKLMGDLLKFYANAKDVVVLAIPAGGVPVANEISKKLCLPLDLAVTRKLHVPWNQEAGFGAISWDGTVLLNKPLIDALGLTEVDIEKSVSEEKKVIQNRLKKFRGNMPFPNLEDKRVIIVDDGLASGFSMLVTIKTLREIVKEIIVAVPTASVGAINLISPYADKIYCLNVRSGSFFAVANAYLVWNDLTDENVLNILIK